MIQCSTPLSRAITLKEQDLIQVIEINYMTAANLADEIYGTPYMIANEYPEEEAAEKYKERLIFLQSTLQFLYAQTLKENAKPK